MVDPVYGFRNVIVIVMVWLTFIAVYSKVCQNGKVLKKSQPDHHYDCDYNVPKSMTQILESEKAKIKQILR